MMVKKFDITKILRVLAIFSLVFMMAACSENDKVSNAATNPKTNQVETAEEVSKKNLDCWQANVVGTIYETTGKLTMSMYNRLTQGTMALMMVAFAVWLSFRLIKHVSSFSEESPAEVWTEVGRKFFVCFVCGLLASSTEGVLFILNSIIFPIYNAFLELGSAMISTSLSDSTTQAYMNIDYNPFGEENVAPQYSIGCVVDQAVTQATTDGFPSSPQVMMECLTCMVNEKLNFGMTIGWKMMGKAGFMGLVCGFILIVCFCFVKLGFVFYMVDSIFRFAMMVMILPLLIMGFAFKPTKSMTKVGFFTILNSGAFMMFIALVMMMVIVAAYQVLNKQKEIIEDESTYADFSVPFIMMLLIAFLVVKSLGIAKTICDKLVGGGGDAKFQKTSGAFIVFVGKQAVKRIAPVVGHAAVALAEKTEIGRKGLALGRAAGAKAGAVKAKMNSFAGRN